MSTLLQAAAHDRLGRLGRLARKEISESLRDRRTVTTLVLMPVLLYPLLAVAFRTLLISDTVDKSQPRFVIGFDRRADGRKVKRVFEFLDRGEQAISWRDTPPEERTAQRYPPPAHLEPRPRLEVEPVDDLERAVADGTVDVAFRFSGPGPVAGPLDERQDIECQILYRDDSANGRSAVLYLERLLAEANARRLAEQLRAHGLREGWYPLFVRTISVPAPQSKKSTLLPVLVPLILILMTITGAVYPAIDLTAGERERGTLEILIAAPIPRLSVLLAKYAAVWTVAMLTALVNVTAMTVTLLASGIGAAFFGNELTLLVLVQVLALLALFAAFFSALLLALTSFARSFKEAQAYLIPLMLLALTPGVLGLMPGLRLDGPLAVVPLLNIVLLTRDLLEGTAWWGSAVVVVTTTLLYALAAVGLAARIFGTEAVLSSEQSGWADVLRRPDEPRSSATLPAALLCLALMFPLSFLLAGAVSLWSGLSVEVRLGLLAGSQVLLFAGLPLVSAWSGRVRLLSGFRLQPPGVLSLVLGLLLGLNLWPWVHEVILFLRQIGMATLPTEQLEKMGESLAQLRGWPVWLVVLILAGIPAWCEEFFFRGYLFRALEGDGRRPGWAIVGSAVLFGLFHVQVANALAVERFPPSFLLGLVLGWLAWKSGSIWPGVVLHVCHNGLLALLGYYEPWLSEQGWMPSAESHLPLAVLGTSGVLAALGLGGVALLRRRVREV
jgi:ABC-2 type transport system permease protein/sodium transport system permease protein